MPGIDFRLQLVTFKQQNIILRRHLCDDVFQTLPIRLGRYAEIRQNFIYYQIEKRLTHRDICITDCDVGIIRIVSA